MELVDLIAFFRDYKKRLLLWIAVFALLGSLLFFLTPTYFIASGALYVTRSAQTSTTGDFSYEGYYSQQNAISQTKNLIAIIESDAFLYTVINQSDANVLSNYQLVRRLSRRVKASAQGPQVIYLSVKDTDPETAQNLWNDIYSNLRDSYNLLNATGDTALNVASVTPSTLIRPAFKHLAVYFAVSTLVGALFGTVYYSVKKVLADI